MIIEKLVVGPLEENTYIIGDGETKQAIVVDPGDEPDRIMDLIKDNNLEVKVIICTHGHFDHIGAAGDIKKETGAKILMHKEDIQTYEAAKDQAAFWGYDLDDIPQPDGFIEEGDTIQAGNLSFKVLHTPGHSPGGICLYGEGIVVTGDTIFQGSVGRTDFPGGSIEELKKSFRRLIELPEETKIFPGHGPESTVGREKETNFFVNELL
ncbi:MAG TPA: MBL fold metallo-hydrolase [Nitrospirae bacterium]|nr:putative metallo-hydrolase [bacterium BMS3Abin06]HDH13108.1 MBL fold metallo-hydrolase [Nitrospirota bacterium]HDZ02869.1 MBL fold metallo-hydrolase [Nitrospirota bacterium]